MYLFTRQGIFTATQDKDTDQRIVLRALTDVDAGRLCDLVERVEGVRPVLYVGAGSTYLFRIYVSRETFARLMAQLAQDLDYPEVVSALADGTARDKVLLQVQYLLAYWQATEFVAHAEHGAPCLVVTCTACLKHYEASLATPDDELACPHCGAAHGAPAANPQLDETFDIWKEDRA